jgi:hypothetical protein
MSVGDWFPVAAGFRRLAAQLLGSVSVDGGLLTMVLSLGPMLCSALEEKVALLGRRLPRPLLQPVGHDVMIARDTLLAHGSMFERLECELASPFRRMSRMAQGLLGRHYLR